MSLGRDGMDTRGFSWAASDSGCGFWSGTANAVAWRQAVLIAVPAAALFVGVVLVAAVHTFKRSESAGYVIHLA